MYLIYSFSLFIALCLYFPVYFIKLRVLKKERLHITDRMGAHIYPPKKGKKVLWIHAVSVGEVMSLQNLIKKMKKTHPDWVIYFSTLTNSGYKVAEEKLTDIDELIYLPFDFRLIVRRFFSIIKPSLFVLTESEFWPQLMREAHRRTQGVLLINGRISSCSYKRYKYIKVFMRKILANIDDFLVQTDEDRKRMELIGADPQRINVAGNLKAEINLKEFSGREVLALKKDLNIPEKYKTIVAGSTRKGEDILLLRAFSKALKKRRNIKLIIAPRHMDRVDIIRDSCEKLHLKAAKKTSLSSNVTWEVLILDTIGELSRIYAVADTAFIGGSLIPWGGQNLLEPAFYGKPVYFGPHMDNFAYLAEEFVRKGGAEIVRSEKELVNLFIFQDEERRVKMGKKAEQTLHSLQGATKKTLQKIESMMS